MLSRDARSRPRRPSRVRPEFRAWSEPLESRRLLAVAPINVVAGLTFATGLPVPGLASGMGLASTAQTLPAASPSVSPAATPAASMPAPAPVGPSATGPSTTLSPLAGDSETAIAAASEVARPTPGRSDRVSSLIVPTEIITLPHLRSPELDARAVVPGPEIQVRPPAIPVGPPERPAPGRPADPVVEPPAPPALAAPMGLVATKVWDLAIELVAAELSGDLTSDSASDFAAIDRPGGAMALGALIAAWGGWKFAARPEGRTSRHPALVSAGPGPSFG